MHDSLIRSRFRRRLLDWFDKNRRELPWRRRKSLYRIWVSEIMLQQTQVETVIGYFNRFVKKYPDIRRLAAADEQSVMHAWEGLGYYRRARQLHAAAKEIVARHNGIFPQTYEEVIALPGIGRYTAGAILSIGADQPFPVLEGNTIRLYSRLMDFRDDVTTTAGQRVLWEFAGNLVSRHRPGDLNQALMELGSQVCRTGVPVCAVCPVKACCKSYPGGQPGRLPNKGRGRPRYEALHQAVVVIERSGKIVLRRCEPGEHWAGLWDFPRFTLASVAEDGIKSFLASQVRDQTGLQVSLESTGFPTIRHAVTRFRIALNSFRTNSVTGRLNAAPDRLKWVAIDDLPRMPMSVTGRKIAGLLS